MRNPKRHQQSTENFAGDLSSLERRVQSDLDCLCFPGPAWVPSRVHEGEEVLDVVIVGGGMCGQLAWFALAMDGVRNVRIIDRNPEGFEGPWLTYARMETLRSPKNLAGPAYRISGLTFQAWYRAKFGTPAWEELDKIPRELWMDYLRWYRAVLKIPVENGVELVQVQPRGQYLRLHVKGAVSSSVLTRKVIFATGREGGGLANIPDFIGELSPDFWSHTAEAINFSALKKKRVAVVGAGASAIENAAEALEAGAHEVRVLIRRDTLPTINKMMGLGSGGFFHGFAELSDAWRWRILQYTLRMQTPPPRSSVLRVSRHANAYFHFGTTIASVQRANDDLSVRFDNGKCLSVDYLILGTGFVIDPKTQNELGSAAKNILQWRDVYHPPANEANGGLGLFPYLNGDFTFREREPGMSPWISHLYCFNYAAIASQGQVCGDIPGISYGAALLARCLCERLYAEDIDRHWQDLQSYSRPELLGNEWARSEFDTSC